MVVQPIEHPESFINNVTMTLPTNIDELYKRALSDAQNFIKAPPEPKPAAPSAVKPVTPVEKLHEKLPEANRLELRWQDRKLHNQNIPDTYTTDVLIMCDDIKELKNIKRETTYCIVGDYKTGRTTGGGCYIVGVDDSKFYSPSGMLSETYIYLGQYSNRHKTAQRSWPHGDIRSFHQIDFSSYKNYFDPGSGKIPSTACAAYLHARANHPGKHITICINTTTLTAYDQVILNRLNADIINVN